MSKKLRLVNIVILFMISSMLVFIWAPAGVQAEANGAPGLPPGPTPDPDKRGKPIPTADKIEGPLNFGEPAGPTATGGPDHYGYTWDDGVAMAWKDATGGTQLFPPPGSQPTDFVDDEVSDPINLGWVFPFYENNYSQVYIGDNGLVGFDPSIEGRLAAVENLFIPFDYQFPQNIIAPFWDDLVIGGGVLNSGKVYYDSGTDGKGNFFVIEWHQVSRNDEDDSGRLLTFEIVIYQDGDILLQYQAIDPLATLDSATVGIEDSDGVDGLQYLYNSAGLASGKAILFERPGADDRVKAFPHRIDAFSIDGNSTFQFKVRNSGGPDADTINLSWVASQPGWGVSLYAQDGSTPLVDSVGDADGVIDSGLLNASETFTVTAKVTSPGGAAGEYVDITLTAASGDNPGKTQDIHLISAIPAPFSHTYRGGREIYAESISRYNRYNAQVYEFYRGSSFAINGAQQPNFFGAWENNRIDNGLYTDLQYIMIDSTGQVLFQPRYIAFYDDLFPYRDTKPVVATAPNGNIGVAWVRSLTKLGNPTERRTNVYFTLLDDAGNLLYPDGGETPDRIRAVTNDNNWYNGSEIDVLSFDSVRITASDDNKFHLSWVEKHTITDEITEEKTQTSDIGHAIYSAADGAELKVATVFTVKNLGDQIDFVAPAMAAYTNPANDQLVMLAYFENDTSGPTQENRLLYALIKPDGSTTPPGVGQTQLYDNANGLGLDIKQLVNNRVALSWTNPDTNKVTYVILEHNLSGPLSPTALDNPDQRLGGRASVTCDGAGGAIISWMDEKWFGRLYYALVDHNGSITPPMVLIYPDAESLADAQGALETQAGEGNAPYSPWWRIDVPLILN